MIAIKWTRDEKSLPYSCRPVASTFKRNHIGSARDCRPGKSSEKHNPHITVDASNGSLASSLVGENPFALKQHVREHAIFHIKGRTEVALVETYGAASRSTLHSTLNIQPPDQHQRVRAPNARSNQSGGKFDEGDRHCKARSYSNALRPLNSFSGAISVLCRRCPLG